MFALQPLLQLPCLPGCHNFNFSRTHVCMLSCLHVCQCVIMPVRVHWPSPVSEPLFTFIDKLIRHREERKEGAARAWYWWQQVYRVCKRWKRRRHVLLHLILRTAFASWLGLFSCMCRPYDAAAISGLPPCKLGCTQHAVHLVHAACRPVLSFLMPTVQAA